MTAAALLCIGTELTRGEIVNTNASWLAARLTEQGFDVDDVSTVDDDPARIVAALARLGASHGVVVATGGLGPTTDDLTAASVAQALSVPLVRDEGALDAIRARFARIGRPMSPSNEKQADFPAGAEVLPNPVGTAPGFAVSLGGARAYFLPGVPREMTRMFDEQVTPRIAPLAQPTTAQVRLRTFGLPESRVGEMLAGLEAEAPGLTIGYRASFPEIEVKAHARAATLGEAQALAARAAAAIRGRLGDAVFAEGDEPFPAAVARAVRERGFRVALAESCTGGLALHLLTRSPASDYLAGGAVTYANAQKTSLLGVPPALLERHGAVSREVAAAMAEGVRRACDVDVGVAITGIAGPTGATADKPLGLVHWAVAHAGGTVARERVFSGERDQVQTIAAYAALALLRDVCLGRA